MAITKVTIARGYDKVFGDTAAIAGLVSASVRRCDYSYKPMNQPGVVYPQRLIELTYKPPASPGPAQNEPAALDFYRRPQTPWTIFFLHTVDGTEIKHSYNVILLECTMIIADSDETTFKVVFAQEEEQLKKTLNAEKPNG